MFQAFLAVILFSIIVLHIVGLLTYILSAILILVNTDADEEAFEDNAEEYIRRDVEGSG